MAYLTRRYEPDPSVRFPTAPNAGASGNGQARVTGYYPNVISGSSVGGQREVPQGGTLHDGVSNMRPSKTQFDTLVDYQRMPYYRTPSPFVPAEQTGRLSGRQDPLASGPERSTLHTMSRSNYIARGTTDTRNLDNSIIEFSKVGVQDGVSYVTVMDPIKSNPRLSPFTPESAVTHIAPSGPHGTHSRNPKKAKAVSNANYTKKDQQVATGQNRLANSNRAGQSYSATTQHLSGNNTGYTRGGLRRGSF